MSTTSHCDATSFHQALTDRGFTASALSVAQREQLATHGVLLITGVLAEETCGRMARRLDDLVASEGERAGEDFQKEAGTQRLGSLVNKDPLFDICFLHPLVLAGMVALIEGAFGVSSISSRTALPGAGAQALHTDSPPGSRVSGHAMWLIDDFTAENGATRIVPGSHRSGRAPFCESIPDWDPHLPHPDEQLLLGPSGSLVLMQPTLWHAGTANRSPRGRRLVSCYWQTRGQYQAGYRGLRRPALERLDASAQYLLDHLPDPEE